MLINPESRGKINIWHQLEYPLYFYSLKQCKLNSSKNLMIYTKSSHNGRHPFYRQVFPSSLVSVLVSVSVSAQYWGIGIGIGIGPKTGHDIHDIQCLIWWLHKIILFVLTIFMDQRWQIWLWRSWTKYEIQARTFTQILQ